MNRAGYFSGDLEYTGSLIGPSDERLKQNIQPITGALAKVMQLKPHTFTFKTDGDYGKMNLAAGPQFGLIAQELEQTLPELVVESSHPLDPPEDKSSKPRTLAYKGVKYIDLIPVLIQAIKEQQEKIEQLESKIQQLMNR